MRTYVAAKIHDLTVTDAHLRYIGSVTIDAELLGAAGIDPYEQVDIVNLNNGARWTTYALPGDPGVFTLNGGGARLGEPGDRCVIMTYQQAPEFPGARAVFCDERNRIVRQLNYPLDPESIRART